MKCGNDFYLKNMGHFESRGEARFFLWCREHDIPIESKPSRIYGFGEQSWQPDFCLTEFVLPIYIEIKPLTFWFETKRTKEIVIAAIIRGEEFWVWFVDNEWKKPRIYEWTCYRQESKDPIQKQMRTFILRDHPEDLSFLEDQRQLVLF